jgi:acyl carrier protein
MEIKNILMEFISQNFSVEIDEIDPEKSLVYEGVIDSTGLIEIIDFLERQFCIEIPEDQWTKENFGSILKIIQLIEYKINLSGAELSKAV